MGKFRLEVTDIAKKHLNFHYKSGNKATINKIEKILIELSEHPLEGTGNPEQLKYELKGLWSRRLNLKDRIIYSIDNEIVTVEIVSALGHYGDK